MKLAKKYLLCELLKVTGTVTFVLLFIFVSNQFVRFLGSAASDNLSSEVIKWILLLQIPTLLALVLSVALYLSIVFIYGRLSVDNELVILQTSGFSFKNFTKINLLIGVVIATIVAILTFWVNPKLHQYIEWLSKSTQSASLIKPKRFNYVGKDRDWLVYADDYDFSAKNTFKKVFIKSLSDKNNCIILAKKATMVDKHKLMLVDGNQYCGVFNRTEVEHLKFKSQIFYIRPPKFIAKKESGKLNQELWKYRYYSKNGAELFWRISPVLMVFILVMLATSLSILPPRSSRYRRVGWAILIYVFYANGLFMTRAMLQKGTLHFGCNAFFIHFFMLIITTLIYWRQWRKW